MIKYEQTIIIVKYKTVRNILKFQIPVFQLQRLRTIAKNSFSYQLLNLSFPEDRQQKWKTLFKPCAAQRLFLPVRNHNMSYI